MAKISPLANEMVEEIYTYLKDQYTDVPTFIAIDIGKIIQSKLDLIAKQSKELGKDLDCMIEKCKSKYKIKE